MSLRARRLWRRGGGCAGGAAALLLTAPAAEPLTLAEARAFLRVEHNDDDDLIAALIAGARIHVEAQTRRALITQSWRLILDAWPVGGRVDVRPAPLQPSAMPAPGRIAAGMKASAEAPRSGTKACVSIACAAPSAS